MIPQTDPSLRSMTVPMPNQKIADALTAAIQSHGVWKMKLRNAIQSGKSDIDARTTSCDDKCAFGQWLHGPSIDVETRRDLPFRVVRRLHAEFHQSAGEIVNLVEKGRARDAETLLASSFSAKSEKLVLALRKWRGEVQEH